MDMYMDMSKLPNQGCAPTCTWRATMLRNQQPCEDVSANHSSWQKFWLDYACLGRSDGICRMWFEIQWFWQFFY